MSNRRESLKRIKRLNRATRRQTFERRYILDGEESDQGRSLLVIVVALIIAAILSTLILVWLHFGGGSDDYTASETEALEQDAGDVEDVPDSENAYSDTDSDEISISYDDNGNSVATFLQGPKSWKKKREWSGEWGDTEIDGRRFGSFGCGLCVMANFYSSLTPYQCSPVDMYKYAKKNSGYEGAGAIDWPYITRVLSLIGFEVDTGRRPKSYERFRTLIAQSEAAMVVISSDYDDSYWKDTPGHYVTLFEYNGEDDTVFLGDSGNPKHNRSRIPLMTVYKAIKKSNSLHYMRILDYEPDRDAWKHTDISGDWVKPSYWKK